MKSTKLRFKKHAPVVGLMAAPFVVLLLLASTWAFTRWHPGVTFQNGFVALGVYFALALLVLCCYASLIGSIFYHAYGKRQEQLQSALTELAAANAKSSRANKEFIDAILKHVNKDSKGD